MGGLGDDEWLREDVRLIILRHEPLSKLLVVRRFSFKYSTIRLSVDRTHTGSKARVRRPIFENVKGNETNPAALRFLLRGSRIQPLMRRSPSDRRIFKLHILYSIAPSPLASRFWMCRRPPKPSAMYSPQQPPRVFSIDGRCPSLY